ncbi:FtsX-like permease family protein [Corynebacterium pseudotuberculosis]|uniref:FtsX-like permease family protein n=1 Tax=Corynebacterium pseudotuberculosis TaxID=1719 RepID=UPI0001DD4864|nr:FtsX-like permease family protein [Corynebacterium pseudotuberculosis]ADK29267.1 FtsX-like permease family protein [Corynebacterium pseudotuberculosis FRC41]ADL21336.1 ABC transporter permease [Corynebacterium pseudotuberculosis 1002]ADO26734.1 FtsX-like permease family protein [Corynebacterium pseudotuberculosis I19]AEK92797.1 ABC transporter inner membrane protein [Corynebacterium pseudotuberculosis PAT10]AEX39965.1 ABC transporter inner membrane protein [Corynebacterium pseudotuberculosi
MQFYCCENLLVGCTYSDREGLVIAKIAVKSVLKGAASWIALLVTSVALSIVLTLNIALIVAGIAVSGEAQQAYIGMGGVALGFTILTGLASFSLVVSTCVRLQRRDVALWQIVGILPHTAFIILLLEVLLVSFVSAVVGAFATLAVWPAYARFVEGSGLPHSEVLQQSIPISALIIGVMVTVTVSVLTGIRAAQRIVHADLVEGAQSSSAFWDKSPSTFIRLCKAIVGIGLLLGVIAIYWAIGKLEHITEPQKVGDFLTTYPGMGILLCITFVFMGTPLIHIFIKLIAHLPGRIPHFLASREATARPSLTRALVVPISLAAAAVGIMTSWVSKIKDVLQITSGSSSSVSAPPEQMALLLAGPIVAACVAASSIIFATATSRWEDNALLVVSGSTPGAAYVKAIAEALIYASVSLACAYILIIVNEFAMVAALSAGPIPSAPLSIPGLSAAGVVVFGTVLILFMLLVVTLTGFRKQSIAVVLGNK